MFDKLSSRFVDESSTAANSAERFSKLPFMYWGQWTQWSQKRSGVKTSIQVMSRPYALLLLRWRLLQSTISSYKIILRWQWIIHPITSVRDMERPPIGAFDKLPVVPRSIVDNRGLYSKTELDSLTFFPADMSHLHDEDVVEAIPKI